MRDLVTGFCLLDFPAPSAPATAERSAFGAWVEKNAERIWAHMRNANRRDVTFNQMAEHLWLHG